MPVRTRAADSIIARLRADIASKSIPLGSRLPNERDLAAYFGVSQPTVREAIRALAAMGLIEVRHGSGAYVTANLGDFVSSTLSTLVQVEGIGILDALEVRKVLALFSIRRAAAEATDTDLARIRYAADLCEQADDIRAMAQAVVWFQVEGSRAAHSPLIFALESFLIRILVQLQLAAEADRGRAFWRQQTSRFAEYRDRVWSALSQHDEGAAVEAMTEYLDQQRSWMSNDPGLRSVTLSDPDLAAAVTTLLVDMPMP